MKSQLPPAAFVCVGECLQYLPQITKIESKSCADLMVKCKQTEKPELITLVVEDDLHDDGPVHIKQFYFFFSQRDFQQMNNTMQKAGVGNFMP